MCSFVKKAYSDLPFLEWVYHAYHVEFTGEKRYMAAICNDPIGSANLLVVSDYGKDGKDDWRINFSAPDVITHDSYIEFRVDKRKIIKFSYKEWVEHEQPGLVTIKNDSKKRSLLEQFKDGREVKVRYTAVSEGYKVVTFSLYGSRSAISKVLSHGKKVGSVQPSPSKTAPSSHATEIGRDGVYIAYANGIVRDTRTGLEWVAGPVRDSMTWNEAESWVESLNIAGSGWRMPTMDELKGLYRKGASSRNMTPLLKIKGWLVWSGEKKGSSSAWGFDFKYGSGHWYPRNAPLLKRAFAVRSRSDGLKGE